jgi:PAS domain S-box-containing protein
MKHLIFTIDDTKSYQKAKQLTKKKKYRSSLIQLFSGILKHKKIQKILDKLAKDFPDAVIIGTTTAGEIIHGKMVEENIVISLSLFENTTLRASYTPKINKKGAKSFTSSLQQKYTKAVVMFAEGLQPYNYENFLNHMKKNLPGTIIAGGLAGDNFKLKKTYIFFQNTIYNQGAVAVSFSSKNLYATNRYNLNWIPIGKEFHITKVQHNVVYEINNTPATEFFKKYLGTTIFDQDTQALPNFQLLFQEGSTTVARTPLAVDGNALVFAAPIQKDQIVQFGFTNENIVFDGAYKLQTAISQHPSEAIYIFSCIARKTLLGKKLQKEFLTFEKLAPSAGFFTYGEFYSTDANEALLNCTTTILVLSEKKHNKITKIKKSQKETLDSITFQALSHFIKQTSKELKANIKLTEEYKQAVDASLLVSKTDLEGNITYANENFCRISKYHLQELIGKNHNIVRDPSVPKALFAKMWKTIQNGKVYRGIFSNKAKDGTIYFVDATVMPIFNEDGKIYEYIALRKDITKQIKAKERIQQKEQLIRALLDNQDSIVIHASKTRGMQSINKTFFNYFHFKNLEDFKKQYNCICDLFIDEEGFVTAQKYPNWLDMIAKDHSRDYKVKMRTKTGDVRTFTIRINKIGTEEYIINLYDITTLERALQKANASERTKSAFLANMSHEIRTPLNGILGFTDVLTQKELDRESKRYVEIIKKSGETLLNIVNDILDFSKLESGEFTLSLSPVNLFKEMEATVATFASVARQKKINYYTYIDPNLPKTICCDVQRIKQVMNNLISNALKFTPQDGKVTVSIELQELQNNQATIHFSVSDTGIGIAQEKIASIFHPFSQADNSISKKFGGTGLGLAISNQYINMMGSHIDVISKEGEGSEFFFDVTFEVTNSDKSLTHKLYINDLNIGVLSSLEGIECGISSIVETYLKAWSCHYSTIETFEQINESIDILIVCAKVFDQEQCQRVLQRYPQLRLVYIEGSQTNFTCEHPRFFLLDQPMTGSSLFDTLISLIDPQSLQQKTTSTQTYTVPKFHGTVLVAEDNETNQMLISIMLKDRGVNYTIVSNGQEALNKALEKNYDLILMDINMPVLDGIGATKQLRTQGYNNPIVSLSANVIESDTQAFKAAGMDDILHKPIVPDELDTILQKYLQKGEKEQFEGDVIVLETIAKALGIPDTAIIKELLQSLKQTLLDIEDTIKKTPLNAALLHRLKGAVGNMRVEKLYKLCEELEKEFESLDPQLQKEKEKLLLQHIHHVIKQIESL